MLGAIIDKGPREWQVIQQRGGNADIPLEGRWIWSTTEGIKIYARVMTEAGYETVVPWTRCELFGDGQWRCCLRGVPAGGPYRIDACLKFPHELEHAIEMRGDVIHFVCVGDLYVIAGQSNAVGYAREPMDDPPEFGVHILRNDGRWAIASHPMNDGTGSIHEENLEYFNPGQSLFLQFGKMLKKELGYPIGFIQTSLGGSQLDRWNPGQIGDLYHLMARLIREEGGAVKGVLWDQGGGDALSEELSSTYLARFEKMVTSLRQELDDPGLPFFTIQINRSLSRSGAETDRFFGMVREAQRQAALKIDGVYVISVLDCPVYDAAHYTAFSNLNIAGRMARAVLCEVYGRSALYKSPDIRQARRDGEKRLLLVFGNIVNHIHIFQTDAGKLPFTVIDPAGAIPVTGYEITGLASILLHLGRTPGESAVVHGAFEADPSPYVPVDLWTFYPMLSFYDVPVE